MVGAGLTLEELAQRQVDACRMVHRPGCATYASLSQVCDCGTIEVAPWVKEQSMRIRSAMVHCQVCGAAIDVTHLGAASGLGMISGVRCGTWLGVVQMRETGKLSIAFACSENCATICVERGTIQ